VSIVRGRAARRRSLSPTGMEKKEGLAGLADAAAQLRALAAGLGEPGTRIRELAASVEAAGCAAVNEQRSAGQRTKRLLGEVISVRDEVEDILRAVAADSPGRENLGFLDELLEQVLTKAGARVMTVPIGAAWDPTRHEPRPERSHEPRGTVLRVERKGYISSSGHGPPKVLRSAKVVVSDGSGAKEA
jgi:molecular chaperone GrpE (heat shock protein)